MPSLLGIESGRVASVATFYKTSELLGVGRYSEVYKAFDTHSHTDVALKVYVGFDSAAHERAANETALLMKLGALNSEYFPSLRRSVKHRIKNQNHPLLVLELGAYVGEDGLSHVVNLKDVMAQAQAEPETGPLLVGEQFWCVDTLIRWMVHLAQAVKLLHSISVIHRDIKPANILLKRGSGRSEATPFLLDYNSACDALGSDSQSGTPRYLPPEVKLGKRLAPSPEDDLWAVAMIGCEMLFGQVQDPRRAEQVAILKGRVPDQLRACLSRALEINPEMRYPTAEELTVAFEACLPKDGDGGKTLSSQEVMLARSEMDRIRRVIGQVLAPPGQVLVPKDIDDSITTIFSWLSHEDSQSLNLVSEIVKLGPVAIPACLQHGYRLRNKGTSYEDVVAALGQLGAKDCELARQSVDAYALSSNRGVRELCWRTCEVLGYFPQMLLTSLISDEGLLLPEERLNLAVLCIRFSSEPTAVPALVKYMCREYLLDRGRYHEIRTAVAQRMCEVQGRETARAIWDACLRKVWTELPEFRNVREDAKEDVERGLIELLGDAFSSTPDSGLQILKSCRNQWLSQTNQHRMFRRFPSKAGSSSAEVRAWLIDESSRAKEDRRLKKIVEGLGRHRDEVCADPRALLREYLKDGNSTSYNRLRFLKDERLFDALSTHVGGKCSHHDLGRILKLLQGYESRNRFLVVDVLLRNWPILAGRDYQSAIDILTAYPISSDQREEAARLLGRDLSGANKVRARKALEVLLR